MDILVPLTFFAFLGAIIIIPQVLKSRDRQRMLDTMRVAYEKGQEPPPELVAAMTQGRGGAADLQALDTLAQTSHDRDLRRGVVWTAIGIGLILIGAISYIAGYGASGDGWRADFFNMWATLGVIPLCVGGAFLALWAFGRRKPAA